MITFDVTTRIIEFAMMSMIIILWFWNRWLTKQVEELSMLIGIIVRGLDVDVEEMADKAAEKFVDELNKIAEEIRGDK